MRRRFASRARYRRTPNTTLLLADDGFVWFHRRDQPEQRDAADRRQRRSAGSSHGFRSAILRGSRAACVSFPWASPLPAPSEESVPAVGSPPPFRDPDGTTIANAHLRVVFAPFAGARVAELDDGLWNAATSIGLLRDATDPQPPPSARDYIAAYTHPIAAGTFNRAYDCTRTDVFTSERVACSYDAPDVPRRRRAL